MSSGEGSSTSGATSVVGTSSSGEPNTDDATVSTGEYGSTTEDPGFETDAVTDTDDPVGCDAWEYAVIRDSATPFTATDIAGAPEGLLLAGTPSSDAVSLAAPTGDFIWSHALGGPDSVELHLREVIALEDGNLLVSGQRYPEGGAAIVAWLAQLDATGTIAWQADFGSMNASAWAHIDLETHPAGGYVLSTTSPSDELRAMRVSAEGELLWDEEAPTGGTVAINWSRSSMDVTPSGDIVQLTAINDGLRVVRRSAEGELLWQQDLPTGTWPQDIVALPNEDVFLLSFDTDTTALTRLDAEGTELWSEHYAYGPGSNMSAIAWDEQAQRLLVGGGTRGIDGPNPTWFRTWILILDGDGQLRWQHVGDPGTPSMTLDIYVDPASNRFVLTSHGESLHLAEVTGEPCD